MIKVRPYRPGDAYFMDPMEEIFKPVEYMKASTDMLAIEKSVEAFSFVDTNGMVIAICGVTLVWPGVLELWTLLSEEVKKYPFLIHRTVKRKLEFYRKKGIRRFQASVKADYAAGCRWVLKLGFVLEGRMEKWGPDGSDFLLFARVN